MIKLFISQPMNGRNDEEIKAEREEAKNYVQYALGEPIEVIDSFFENAPAQAKPLWYLGKSIELLSTADVVHFCDGWENARGCKVERYCAEKYGITII